MRPVVFPLCAIALAALALGGCTDLKRALGMEKVVPDEFAVVSRAPLAIPPDYALRPPRPGAEPTQETSATDQAKQSIFRAGDQQAALPPAADQRSPGESELLREAGAGSAPADIRETITREARQGGPMDESFVDKLLFWRGPAVSLGPTDQVIDPQAESQRLKGSEAAAAAAATPSGMTGAPVIERRQDPSMVSTF
jgi:hypothetical protein